jgi:hypothetical protein
MRVGLWHMAGVRLDLPAFFLAGLERQEPASRDIIFAIEDIRWKSKVPT